MAEVPDVSTPGSEDIVRLKEGLLSYACGLYVLALMQE
jgi:hypothetical protein